MGAAPFLCQFLILVEEEVFIKEYQLYFLKGVWPGILVCILGGSFSDSLVNMMGCFLSE